MRLRIELDQQNLVSKIANKLWEYLGESKQLGFATGRTMDPIYLCLQGLAHQEGIVPEKFGHAFMVDEYLGLAEGHIQSYAYYLLDKVFLPLKYPKDKIHFPKIHQMSAQLAALEYEETIKRHGGIDLQLLGIGLNGHIGLNEPNSDFSSRTRVVDIAQSTRIANSSLFSSLDEVPTQAITLGLETIHESREIYLIATGEGKASVISDLLNRPANQSLPASSLKEHTGLTIWLDEKAASLLDKKTRDFYMK